MLAVVAAFGLSLTATFVFDDHSIFTRRPPPWWLETRPLTWASFWLNQRLGGVDPAGYHATNLAIHLINVVLASAALVRLIPRRAALIASGLFALHPIQTEAVVYVFARGTLLATLLCLVSLWLWTRGRHWPAAAAFAFALSAKEECAAFPLALLLLHLATSRDRRERAPIGVMLALSVAAGLRVIVATRDIAGAGSGFGAGVTPWEYFATQGVVILRYLRLLIVPWGFSADPDITVVTGVRAWLAWLVVAGLIAVAMRHLSGGRAGMWFLAGLALLAPSSSIFPAADLAADRRMYLPLVAFSACAGLALERVRAPYLAAAAGALIVLSFMRTAVWRSEASLWSEAARLAPRKVRPKIQLARVVEPHAALAILREARALAPNDAAVAAETGRVHLTAGSPSEALAEFGRALALAPNDARYMNNRGVALLALGQRDAARGDFERALALDPCLDDARHNLERIGVVPPAGPRCSGVP